MKLQLQENSLFEEESTRFVEVIIPLFLEKSFTYRLPRNITDSDLYGKRVIVPFGRRHLYTGIVINETTTPPTEYDAKYVIDLLDEIPIVDRVHLEFWTWLADYYMCSIGEVMDAALPSGMKIKSETAIALNPAFELDSI
ncbi:MAG: primosomal protein N', partial [Bacteroidetes bacterium]|nr:primosomal protein N' [Bacteroidota bacterium]